MQLQTLLAAAASLLLAPLAGAAHLPAEYPVCKRNDPDKEACFKKAITVAVKVVASGIPTLGVVPVDPLNVPKIEVSDGTSNINLKITFTNVRVTGLSRATVEHASMDLDNNKLRFGGTEPHLVFEADYVMNGKFLVVPVQGSGKCQFVFHNLTAELGVDAERRTKSGQEFWEVVDFPMSVTKVELMQINFDNLFNGDPTLGPGFNKLLNENWAEFWSALRPTFEQSFAVLFKDFSYKVFSKVPLDEVFPPK